MSTTQLGLARLVWRFTPRRLKVFVGATAAVVVLGLAGGVAALVLLAMQLG